MNSPTNEILFTTSKPTRRPITSTTTQNPCRHGNSLSKFHNEARLESDRDPLRVSAVVPED